MSDLASLVSRLAVGGQPASRPEIDALTSVPLTELLAAADDLRRRAIGPRANLCTILNAKSGVCSENCRYCAQSVHYRTTAEVYPMVTPQQALKTARRNEASGVQRFSLVTSGRMLAEPDFETALDIYRLLRRETTLKLCASFGLLTPQRAAALRDAGVDFYHHNLEACRDFFPQTCTTHTWEERRDTIRIAQAAGLTVCSGGIFGLGETRAHRIDLAFELRELDIRSIPLNILMPIAGTPLENEPSLPTDEILRTMALFRFVLPQADIRFAGGRAVLGDQTETALRGGINAALTGDFLTTSGSSTASDIDLFTRLGFELT